MQQQKAVSRNPLRQVAIVLYATLALLWLAIPQSVTNWTREFLPEMIQPYATPLAETVEAIANKTYLPSLYTAARTAFQSATKN